MFPVINNHKQISATFEVKAVDEYNADRLVHVVAERPLVVRIDDKEVVTLMTLGSHPEALVLGYLKNQRLIQSMDELDCIEINWDSESAEVTTKNGIKNLSSKIANRVVTTGCGQGTVFSCTIDEVYKARLSSMRVNQKTIYKLLNNLNQHNTIYKNAGAVHTCALCKDDQVILSVEDVGRHNAADIISGLMWMQGIYEMDDYVFYTTGRITSEIVIKIAQMGISVVLSRSGVTQMGLEIAEDVGMMVIARAKNTHFLLYTDAHRMVFDTSKK